MKAQLASLTRQVDLLTQDAIGSTRAASDAHREHLERLRAQEDVFARDLSDAIRSAATATRSALTDLEQNLVADRDRISQIVVDHQSSARALTDALHAISHEIESSIQAAVHVAARSKQDASARLAAQEDLVAKIRSDLEAQARAEQDAMIAQMTQLMSGFVAKKLSMVNACLDTVSDGLRDGHTQLTTDVDAITAALQSTHVSVKNGEMQSVSAVQSACEALCSQAGGVVASLSALPDKTGQLASDVDGALVHGVCGQVEAHVGGVRGAVETCRGEVEAAGTSLSLPPSHSIHPTSLFIFRSSIHPLQMSPQNYTHTLHINTATQSTTTFTAHQSSSHSLATHLESLMLTALHQDTETLTQACTDEQARQGALDTAVHTQADLATSLAVSISEHLEGKYKEDEPTGQTPTRRHVDVPHLSVVTQLRVPAHDVVLQSFHKRKADTSLSQLEDEQEEEAREEEEALLAPLPPVGGFELAKKRSQGSIGLGLSTDVEGQDGLESSEPMLVSPVDTAPAGVHGVEPVELPRQNSGASAGPLMDRSNGRSASGRMAGSKLKRPTVTKGGAAMGGSAQPMMMAGGGSGVGEENGGQENDAME